MSILSRLSNWLTFVSTRNETMVNSAADFSLIPEGFFVARRGDIETLGYKHILFGISFDVRKQFTAGGRLISLDKAPEELPVVHLNLRSQRNGVYRFNGGTMIDTDAWQDPSDSSW